jgi:pimeloyl-ACP methyl ester carboxylesterase
MKPPVVLLHGAFCGAWAMSNLKSAFDTAGFSVHAPNLRHHGGDRNLSTLATTSMRDYAADIRTLINSLPQRPVIVGHSMGGLIAQMLAAEGVAEALILLAPSAPWGVLPSHWKEVASGFGLYQNGRYWEQALIPVFEIAAEHILHRLPKNEQRAAFAQMVPESGRAVFEILQWWLDIGRATEVPVAKVTCPIFCAAGGYDTINAPETVRRIAARYRGQATFRLYEKMSHWLIGEPEWSVVASDAIHWLELQLSSAEETATP